MVTDPVLCGDALLPRRAYSFSSDVIPGVIAFIDSAAILATAGVTFRVIVGDLYEELSYYLAAITFVWIVTLGVMHFAGLYKLDPIERPLHYVDKILMAFATSFLFLLAAAFCLKISSSFSRVWMAYFAFSACVGTLGVRLVAGSLVRALARRKVFTRRVVVAGAAEQTARLLAHVARNNPRFVTVLGTFAVEPAGEAAAEGAKRDGPETVPPRLGSMASLPAYLRTHVVDDIIIALPWSAEDRIVELVGTLRELPVNVYLAPDLIGFRLPFKPSPDHFGQTPLVEVMGRPLAGWGALQKTIFDYTLATILTVFLLPVMALVALAVRLDSPGPAIFRQQRYGFVNRVFSIFKFRTMAQQDQRQERTVQATRDDPRVTRVGRLLRRWSLDELPQLFNILNGTMSLVGPRPHAIDHNEEYARLVGGYFARHRVKPGITGWAQVHGLRGETRTVEELQARVKYDIDYTENWSLLLDLKILLLTLAAIVRGKNAY